MERHKKICCRLQDPFVLSEQAWSLRLPNAPGDTFWACFRVPHPPRAGCSCFCIFTWTPSSILLIIIFSPKTMISCLQARISWFRQYLSWPWWNHIAFQVIWILGSCWGPIPECEKYTGNLEWRWSNIFEDWFFYCLFLVRQGNDPLSNPFLESLLHLPCGKPTGALGSALWHHAAALTSLNPQLACMSCPMENQAWAVLYEAPVSLPNINVQCCYTKKALFVCTA